MLVVKAIIGIIQINILLVFIVYFQHNACFLHEVCIHNLCNETIYTSNGKKERKMLLMCYLFPDKEREIAVAV